MGVSTTVLVESQGTTASIVVMWFLSGASGQRRGSAQTRAPWRAQLLQWWSSPEAVVEAAAARASPESRHARPPPQLVWMSWRAAAAEAVLDGHLAPSWLPVAADEATPRGARRRRRSPRCDVPGEEPWRCWSWNVWTELEKGSSCCCVCV
jgi:hypothetical protein